MKQLIQTLLILSLLGGISFAQRSFGDKENRSTTPTKPGLPYIDIDGRQTAPGNSPYSGFSGTLKRRMAETRRTDITILGRDEAGLPIFLKTSPAAAKNFPAAVEPAALLFLDDIADIIGVEQPSDEFQIRAVEGSTVRLSQVWQGIPIWGADIAVNFMSDGQIVMSGRYRSSPSNVTTQPAVTEEKAIKEALEVVGKHTPVRYLRPIERKILQYPEHQANVMLYAGKETNNELRLVYHMDLRPNFMARWAVWIDAQTGKVIKEYDHTCTVGPVTGSSRDLKNVQQTFSVYDEGSNRFALVDASQPMFNGAANPDLGDGIILTADMSNSTLSNPQFNDIISSSASTWNANAVSAHVNAITSYNYFRNTHSRNSINGTGGDVVSFINVADDDGGGLDNAFWNGRAIFYGSGRTVFQPLARGLDVASHEMSHGVVQETANLEYQDESGALNESFADIFGAMVDRDDWRIGEDVMRSGGGALRDMQNPHNGAATGNFNAGWQPEKYSERYTGSQDNGGVHINSGIPNHAFYLFATSNGVGKAKAELIFYEALNRYLTRSSRFIDLRLAVIQAAENRHGANSTEVNAAKAAFDQVEILDPNGGGGGGSNPGPTPLPGNLQPNPGQDFIVSTDINTGDQNTLYISSTTGTNFQPISQIPHKHKISVTDDGSLGCIVGDDGHIYLLNMNPANPQSQQLSIDPVWENAVLSKDGNRLAAVETSVDTSIYVFNLAATPVTGVRYRLYNPTNTQGVNFSGMLYADAMEFDYSGENLAFDAFNRVPNLSGTDFTFWTIGFMKVWNNGANNFGNGNIELLINQLDPGESIGEPTFSKNSPYIMAFDYITNNPPAGQGSYYLLAMNIETDSIQAIWNQDKLFVPNYSRLDDQIIFNATNGFNDVIAVAQLQADKITRASNPQVLVTPDAQWGVWFSTGQRSLEPTSIDNNIASLPFSIYPNPASDAITCQFNLEAASDVQLELRDMTGREVRSIAPQRLGSGEQRIHFSLKDLPSGSYALRIRTEKAVVTRKVVIQ